MGYRPAISVWYSVRCRLPAWSVSRLAALRPRVTYSPVYRKAPHRRVRTRALPLVAQDLGWNGRRVPPTVALVAVAVVLGAHRTGGHEAVSSFRANASTGARLAGCLANYVACAHGVVRHSVGPCCTEC